LAFMKSRPGQSQSPANLFGLAWPWPFWPGFWPEAKPCTSLEVGGGTVVVGCHEMTTRAIFMHIVRRMVRYGWPLPQAKGLVSDREDTPIVT